MAVSGKKQRKYSAIGKALAMLMIFFLALTGYAYAEDSCTSWDEYRQENNLSSYTWNDVADAV